MKSYIIFSSNEIQYATSGEFEEIGAHYIEIENEEQLIKKINEYINYLSYSIEDISTIRIIDASDFKTIKLSFN